MSAVEAYQLQPNVLMKWEVAAAHVPTISAINYHQMDTHACEGNESSVALLGYIPHLSLLSGMCMMRNHFECIYYIAVRIISYFILMSVWRVFTLVQTTAPTLKGPMLVLVLKDSVLVQIYGLVKVEILILPCLNLTCLMTLIIHRY